LEYSYLLKSFSKGAIVQNRIKVKVDELRKFAIKVLVKKGLTERDAEITADVLITADQRNIESHGVARLQRYVNGIDDGLILAEPDIKIVKETPVSLVVDGGGGMGQPITHQTMEKCIAKAKANYLCFATIRNSNHYGIAGYYTLMALEHDLIGISSTNSAPLVVPTFAKNAVIGTNPISLGVPADKHYPFLLDMATSTVPRGKLEVYARAEKDIPEVWATDEKGNPATNPAKILENLLNRQGGGLSPLGGSRELTGGHKGYGLSALVDIVSGILSDGTVGRDIYGKEGQPAEVCHFIGAINPDAFVGLKKIQQNMDYYIDMLKNNETVNGHDRIYVAGEKEFEAYQEQQESLTLQKKVFDNLNEIGANFDLSLEKH
jgi:LDH2 family malate/lactate/ureidoglycolate dehydrogenase